MKKLAKSIVVAVLGWQVRRLRRKHDFKVVAVAGSIGKTSTKLAIAQLLGKSLRVRSQAGNYNDIVTVPLIFFAAETPSLLNVFAWAKVFVGNEGQIRSSYPYDVVVVEVGTDGIGQIKNYARYLHPDITVITAIAPEHMEFFGELDEVAKEELSIAEYSDRTLINGDLCAPEYVSLVPHAAIYSIGKSTEYQLSSSKTDKGFSFEYSHDDRKIEGAVTFFSETQLYTVLAALAVAELLGLSETDARAGIGLITPMSGRLQLLPGVNGSTLVDDTYNASPEATKAALKSLYEKSAPQRVALLGNMNELGERSADYHTEVGEFCDPAKLDLVVTLGKGANEYLAAAAQQQGCRVIRTTTPVEAGEAIKDNLKPGALVLLKGSQNGVFAEEATKVLLANAADAAKLVRQSEYWLAIKSKQFPDITP